jgi:DNA-binding transcriptional regulator YhcF (GntR family)
MAVLAGDLRPGDRLPSVRVLARRFHLHPNTVSTAYRRLRAEGLVMMRREVAFTWARGSKRDLWAMADRRSCRDWIDLSGSLFELHGWQV